MLAHVWNVRERRCIYVYMPHWLITHDDMILPKLQSSKRLLPQRSREADHMMLDQIVSLSSTIAKKCDERRMVISWREKPGQPATNIYMCNDNADAVALSSHDLH